MLKPVQKSRVYEDVSRQIRDQIESGQWKEGTRIQSETELAKVFQVSRGSIREAIKSLQMAGLLEASSGHGTFVAPNACQKIREGRLAEKLNSAEYYDDILECRLLLESYACGVAAREHTPSDIRFLKENYEKSLQYTREGNIEAMSRCGNEFHSYLVDMVGNEIISDFYKSIMQSLMDEREEYYKGCDHVEVSETHLEHGELIEALEASDPASAQEIIFRHLGRKRRQEA